MDVRVASAPTPGLLATPDYCWREGSPRLPVQQGTQLLCNDRRFCPAVLKKTFCTTTSHRTYSISNGINSGIFARPLVHFPGSYLGTPRQHHPYGKAV